jgi:hypothetical protein
MDSVIPVVWHSQEDGRGCYNCTAMVNDLFDLYPLVRHYAGKPWPKEVTDGAVVIVHGGRQIGDIHRLNDDISRLEWALLVCLGDEECSFPVEQIEHPNRKIWVQEPMPGRHDFADRFLIDGYTPHTKHYVRRLGQFQKNLDWVFAGQVTHERRIACMNALRKIRWGGVIVETRAYCDGVTTEEYYVLLSRARIVPCPSGPCAPDAARPWEALECGAVPILDDLSPTRPIPGFWKYVLGNHPLPVITDWSTLPSRIEQIKSDYERIHKNCIYWWERYKADFSAWLRWDLEDLCTTRNAT